GSSRRPGGFLIMEGGIIRRVELGLVGCLSGSKTSRVTSLNCTSLAGLGLAINMEACLGGGQIERAFRCRLQIVRKDRRIPPQAILFPHSAFSAQ
ncbi:MAG: hypothetical protein ACLPXB_12160, partial [Thiobacillaceae bacterium]